MYLDLYPNWRNEKKKIDLDLYPKFRNEKEKYI